MAEILEFRIPTGNDRTLLVLGLETDVLEHALYSTFAAFGLLYSVKMHRNAPVAGPGYYALVKFYSARDARRAQCACNQQCLFQKSPLKVSLCTRQRHYPQQAYILNSYKCRELANYYLGFNGWSSRIITLQNISGFDEESEEKEVKPSSPRSQRPKFLCIQELTIPRYGIRTRGVGVAELQPDPNQEFLISTYNVQKIAVHRALSDAFQKIFIIVLENGKVAVEYSSPQEDPIECLTEEELKGLIQVSELSHSQLNPIDEEEILADFSINGE
uniref:RAD52 motif-containing protein 1 n=1 Tax=Salvator merianae TaxID=96440 RepID=A0A8D0BLQ5_SALMN